MIGAVYCTLLGRIEVHGSNLYYILVVCLPSHADARAVPGGTFGGAEMTWLRGVECTGVEQNFTHCQSSSPGTFYDCKAHNSTGIWCASQLF